MDERLHEEIRDVGDAHWWYEGRRRIIEAELDRWLDRDPTRRILEVGCGSGSLLPSLARHGVVEGLEPNEASVEHCQRELGDIATVRQGWIPDDLPAEAVYDVVAAFDVLEHLVDDRTTMAAVRSALRPGGLFVATVPAFPSLWGAQDVLSHHHRRYRARSLRDLAVGAGLVVERLTHFNTFLFPPIAAIRWARRTRHPRAAQIADQSSDFESGPASPTVTRWLERTLASERHLLGRFDLPVGVSLLLVARRPLS